MQNPKVIPVRPDTKTNLLLHQRTILRMREQLNQLVVAIQNEEKAFVDLIASEAKMLKVNPKKVTFDIDKLIFVPVVKK